MNPRSRIQLKQGDITHEQVDAIVNAANETLLGGGGVDGAIHRAAGPALLAECRKLGGCPTGEARITGGHGLPARFVIHTVGPVYRDGSRGEPALLKKAYQNSFRLAAEHRLASIALPAVSCGVYGYPLEEAADIAIAAAREATLAHASLVDVRFVLFSERVFLAFERALTALDR